MTAYTKTLLASVLALALFATAGVSSAFAAPGAAVTDVSIAEGRANSA